MLCGLACCCCCCTCVASVFCVEVPPPLPLLLQLFFLCSSCGVCLLFTCHTTRSYVIWATSVPLSDTACASTPPSRMSDLYMLRDQIITGWPATPNVCQSSRPCHCVRQLMMNPSTFVIPSKASSKQRTQLSHLQSIQTNFQYTCNHCDDQYYNRK